MAMAGGAMLGYCAIGSVVMASAPASMTTIANTQAKIGRSMKKLTMAGLLLSRRDCPPRAGLARLRPILLGHHLGTRLGLLDSLDDDSIAGLQPRAHHPLIT